MARLRRALATVAAAAPVLAGAGAAPALAATDSARIPSLPCCNGGATLVTWQNQEDGQYLHVKGASTANSAVVNVYTKSGSCSEHGATNTQCAEVWDQISTGYAHQFAYENVNSGKCLDDPEDESGQVPVQYSCANYPTQRRWEYISDGLYTPHNGHINGIITGGFICLNSGTNLMVDPYNISINGEGPILSCEWQ